MELPALAIFGRHIYFATWQKAAHLDGTCEVENIYKIDHLLYTNSIQDGPQPMATGASMAKKKKSTDSDVLTSIARTVGTAAGIVISTANRLTSATRQEAKPAKRKR